MSEDLISAIEICVSSSKIDCVPTLITSLSPCSSDPVLGDHGHTGRDRVSLHLPPDSAGAGVTMALPRFRQVPVFTDRPDAQGSEPTVQLGQVGHRPKTYEALFDRGVSRADSLGLTTLRIPGDAGAADFAEQVLGMELLAVIEVDSDSDQHLELYLYGFSRPLENLADYHILDINVPAVADLTIDLSDSAALELAEIPLGPDELAVIGNRVGSAIVERPSSDQPGLKPGHVEAEGLGVFSLPLRR